MQRYMPSALASLAFLGAFACFYATALPLLTDADVSWHIAAGDLIREQGKLPATDPWSFTANGQPWYIISWLWDVMLSVVQQISGTAGLYGFTLAAAALSVGLLAGNLRQREGAGTDAIIFTLFIVALSLIEFATARPQLAGYVFVLLFHRLLHQSRTARDLRFLGWLPLVMILWVNMHGSFVAGFILIGLYGVESIMLKRWRWLKALILTGLACVLAALCNPYGIGMYDAVGRTLHSVTTGYIQEWLPFVFSTDLGVSAWFLLFLLASGLRDGGIPIADRLLAVWWWIAMLFSMRNSSIFILVSAPYVALSLQRWVEALDSIRTRRADIGEALAKPGMARKMCAAAVIVALAGAWSLPSIKGQEYLARKSDNPEAAIRYAEQHYAGKRFLTDYTLGGRIIYYARGKVPVFADGRAGTAYSEEVLEDYIAFMNLDADWQEIVKKYRIEGMLLGNSQRFVKAYEDGQYQGWKRVYSDDVASVFVRK